MIKNKYTQEQFDFVAKLVKKGIAVTEATRQMCTHFGLEYRETIGRKFREKMQAKGVTENVKVIEDSKEFKKARKKKLDKSKQRFIFTWCQNGTAIHEKFLDNIEAYAEFLDAEISVVAGRYRNPTSLKASEDLKGIEVWNKRVQPYLTANRHNIHENLMVLGDVKIQPTAATPLTGFNSISGSGSCIIGHPRQHLKTLPILDGYPHKVLLTTGSVSVENYTDSKSGMKGKFNHSYGFVVAELDGDIYHIRQVTADKKGNFFDLFYEVKDGEVSVINSCPAMVFGDLHISHQDKRAVDASFELAGIIKPKIIVIHDVCDSGSISHHEQRNPFVLLDREKDGSWSLKKEIKQMKNWFKEHSGYSYVIPSANHNLWIDTWLKNSDWRKMPNKELYLKYANITAQGKAPKGIVAYILDKNFPEIITTLSPNDSYKIMDWELSLHGDLGASNSRGSSAQFKNLTVKSITGHSHSASREDGNLCVGTLTKLRVGYNSGLSSWIHSNAIIHENGKAQQVHIIRGKYTTLI